MFENKARLREKFSKIRKEVAFRDEKNCKITEKVIQLLLEKSPSSVFAYVSFGSEVDTKLLITRLFSERKVFVPHTALGEMQAVRLTDLDKLFFVDKKGNVYAENEERLEREDSPSVTIVPMLAFSKDLYRLGYGGGYYDKFLSKTNTYKIGLAYDEQLTDELTNEAHDERLDCIVTPSMIYRR